MQMKQFQKLSTDVKDKLHTVEVCLHSHRKIFKFVKKLIGTRTKNKIGINLKDSEERIK